ncbi:MAG TPA: class I SAM-dependent methyltransferase [Streptosporangiaceae bacterium]|nr:class I SAM-dependent methyltransferase [Streptosporangiaceae bacterium]
MTEQYTDADQVRRLFDVKAATWATKYAPDGRLTGRMTTLAAAVRYHVALGGSVLDLGCGTGELARAIAAVGRRATGCDISGEMLSRAVAADPACGVEWVQLYPGWRQLPFAPAIFDAVVAASVLEYVDEPSTILRECARVLRPGGVVLCTVPNLTHPVRWLEWLAGVGGELPPVRTGRVRWPRLDSYLTYLTISRQRHLARWWHAAAASAGLLAFPQPTSAAQRSPLRLLTFQQPDEMRNGT